MKTSLIAYVCVLALSAAAEPDIGTATTLANAVAFSTRLHLSGKNLKASCTTDIPECVTRQDRYTTMKAAIDALVGCLTSTQVIEQCSKSTTVATIETSRYIDLVDANTFTSDKSLAAVVPLFSELLLLVARHYAAGSHHRLAANARMLVGRHAIGNPSQGTQASDTQDSDTTNVLLRFKDLRLPAWSEL